MSLRAEKIAQAIRLLPEHDLDLWLTFVSESASLPDPSLDLILGANVTWSSAFGIHRSGETFALVGSLDVANVEGAETFPQVTGYVGSIRDSLRDVLARLDPGRIGLNYSKNSPMADGLRHGLYLQLQDLLTGSAYPDRFTSSESLLADLRGRKTPTELSRIRAAVDLTIDLFSRVSGFMAVGRTEREIAGFLLDEVGREGVSLAWDPEHCPAVFTGPDSAGAHAGPTDRAVEPGHVLNIDFGVRVDGYCSDLQRTWYFPGEGEQAVPPEVERGFRTVVDAVQSAADFLRPGVTGKEVDAVARGYITERGYEEYPHALGHQIGREAHDGGGLLAPEWERYGDIPHMRVREGQVYTIEPRLPIEGHGVATVEEIVVITADGCEFLSPPQKELWVVGR